MKKLQYVVRTPYAEDDFGPSPQKEVYACPHCGAMYYDFFRHSFAANHFRSDELQNLDEIYKDARKHMKEKHPFEYSVLTHRTKP